MGAIGAGYYFKIYKPGQDAFEDEIDYEKSDGKG